MNATAVKVVDFQNNSANKLAKQSKSAKGRSKKVVMATGVKVTVSLPAELTARLTKSANRYKAIMSTQKKQLAELKLIGDDIAELRRLYESDKVFGQEVEKTPLKAIPRQDRYVLLQLSNNWDNIQTAIKDGKIKPSTSPKLLTDAYRKLTKSEAEPTTTKTPSSNKGKKTTQSKTEAPKTSAKQKATDEVSSQDLPKAEWTEDSVAIKLADIVRKNDLDVDLIFDKVIDLLEAKA